MKQNSKTSLSSYSKVILPHLRHPTKLRMMLCVTIIVGWYAMFFAPLSEQMSETRTLIDKERKRVSVAREIDQLKAKLAPFEKLIPVGGDVNEMRRHVTDHIRSTPLKLIDVKPGKPKAIGPFDASNLFLSIEGKYKDIDDLLAWVERDQRLLRVDTIKLVPATKNPSQLVANLTVLGLTDKASTETRAPAATEPAGANKGGAGGSALKTAVKPSDARTKLSPDAGKTVGAVHKKIGAVRKKIGEVRKEVDDARKNSSDAARSPSTKPPG